MVNTFEEKSDVKVVTTFRIAGSEALVDPDSNIANITIKDITEETTIIDAVAMTRDSEGVYSYWWETGVVARGVYRVWITGEFSTHTYTCEDTVELI